VRVDYYVSQRATAVGVDPRFSARLRLRRGLRLLPATGLVHQPPSFVVPVPGFRPSGLATGLQRSWQSSLALEADLPLSVTGRLTAFRNAFFDLTDPLSIARSVDDEAAIDTRSLGSSYGAELLLRRPMSRRIGGFVSYTLSRNTRSFGHQRTVAAFDRTHVLNAALSYDLGRRWRAGTRLLFYSGVPAAPVGQGEFLPREPDRTRPFYRIDLRLEKRWLIAERAWIAVVMEVLSATGHREVIDVECNATRCTPVYIGPITIPNLGVEGGF